MNEYTILVAFTVEAETPEAAQDRLMNGLNAPEPILESADGPATSWWIAQDDRRDGSDNDSAVFCRLGTTDVASVALYNRGLTEAYNVVIP